MFNTGPSLHTHILPSSVVFSTQHRQAPIPQAILFSNDTSQSMPCSFAKRAIAVIIGFGPQVAIWSKRLVRKIEWSVTKPLSPADPSSVVKYRLPNALKWSSSMSPSAVLAPKRKVGVPPIYLIFLPKKSNGAMPTPPPTSQKRSFLSFGKVKPFPKGSIQLSLSPRCNLDKARVPSPIAATSSHNSLCSLST